MAWKHRGWLGCIKWDGHEKTLPLGAIHHIPGLKLYNLANVYGVVDSSEDDGVREVFRDLLTSEDAPGLIEAHINESSVAAIENSYGADWILFTDPSNGENLTREEWREKFGTDAMALVAIDRMRKRLGQKGVKKT